MEKLVEEALASGVLDKDEHARLIQRIYFFADQTNVPVRYICKGASDWLTKEQTDAVSEWDVRREAGSAGFVFRGKAKASMSSIFAAVGGWMIRNKVDARLYTAIEVAEATEHDYLPDPTVLLIPDFYVMGRKVFPSVIANLHTAVQRRHHRGLFTIVYVESVKQMEQDYGHALASHFYTGYEEVHV